MLEFITFQSVVLGTTFKVIMIMLGLLAIQGASVVNKRHAYLDCMAKILSGQATTGRLPKPPF